MRGAARPRWLVLVFVLAVVVAVLLGGHALWRMGRMEEAAAGPVEAWMTPKFIVHAYHLAPEEIAAALGMEVGSSPSETLEEIAERLGVAPETLVAQIEDLVAARAPAGDGP